MEDTITSTFAGVGTATSAGTERQGRPRMSSGVVVNIPYDARVALLEDSNARINWFQERIPDIVVFKSADAFIKHIAVTDPPFDFVFLDHDLSLLDYAGVPLGGVGSGLEAARYLSSIGFLGQNVFIHSWNPQGAAQMKDELEGAFAIPFGQFEIRRV